MSGRFAIVAVVIAISALLYAHMDREMLGNVYPLVVSKDDTKNYTSGSKAISIFDVNESLSLKQRLGSYWPSSTKNNSTPTTTNHLLSTKHSEQPRIPLCNRAEIRDGEWIAANFSRPPYRPHYWIKRCEADTAFWKNNQSSVWSTFVWKPHSEDCELLSFEAIQFCTLLRNQTLLLIGDSLMIEIFNSFVQQLIPIPVMVYQEKMPNPVVMQLCDGSDRANLVFLKTSILEPDVISTVLKDHSPDIILMNQGAHYVRDDEFMQIINETFRTVLQYKHQHNGRVRILWKTTPPGHPDCWKFDRPVNNVSIMNAMILDPSLYKFHPTARHFYWWEFAHQNELVSKSLDNNTDSVEILDGYDLLLGRPDRHKARISRRRADCLHHCSPGPFDVFPQLLFHYLHLTPQEVMAGIVGRNATAIINGGDRTQRSNRINATNSSY